LRFSITFADHGTHIALDVNPWYRSVSRFQTWSY